MGRDEQGGVGEDGGHEGSAEREHLIEGLELRERREMGQWRSVVEGVEIIGCEEPGGGEQAEERCKERATAEGEQADGHEVVEDKKEDGV